MPRLEQKTAVITGASSGIGQGIARAYAREGAHIVINYNHSKQEAELITEEIRASGGKAIAIQADISDQQGIDRLINEAQAELGCINIWVNNAGADILTGHGATLDDTDCGGHAHQQPDHFVHQCKPSESGISERRRVRTPWGANTPQPELYIGRLAPGI